jgi:hypothetical protein
MSAAREQLLAEIAALVAEAPAEVVEELCAALDEMPSNPSNLLIQVAVSYNVPPDFRARVVGLLTHWRSERYGPPASLAWALRSAAYVESAHTSSQ